MAVTVVSLTVHEVSCLKGCDNRKASLTVQEVSRLMAVTGEVSLTVHEVSCLTAVTVEKSHLPYMVIEVSRLTAVTVEDPYRT